MPAFFNFDFEKEHKTEFAKTKNPARLVDYLVAAKGMLVSPEKTLIIFDKIRSKNETNLLLIHKKQYFCTENF
jgi:hypothetical protein